MSSNQVWLDDIYYYIQLYIIDLKKNSYFHVLQVYVNNIPYQSSSWQQSIDNFDPYRWFQVASIDCNLGIE